MGELDPEVAIPVGLPRLVAERLATVAHPDEILVTRLASDVETSSGVQFVAHAEVGVEGLSTMVPVVRVNIERHLEPVFPRTHGADLLELSPREREVLVLIADGLSNPLIAMRLGLSEHTVKRHVANILLKLDLPTRSAAAGLVARESRS